MERFEAEAVVCTVQPHGEHGAVVRLFTRDHGLVTGYVRGAGSRRYRPVLQPANRVAMDYRSRAEHQLGSVQVDLVHSRAIHFREPLAAAAYRWLTLLVSQALPERHAYPRLFNAFEGVLDAVAVAPSARGWAAGIVHFEALLIAELGFGLDLNRGAATGVTTGLAFVDPRTGRAVSEAGAGPYRERLLTLPSFLLDGSTPEWEEVFEGLALTAPFLERNFFGDLRKDRFGSRTMLTERLKRAVA